MAETKASNSGNRNSVMALIQITRSDGGPWFKVVRAQYSTKSLLCEFLNQLVCGNFLLDHITIGHHMFQNANILQVVCHM
ncbi:hypothetical protein SUGI_0337270 [Cryptomeria japonica]|nr:hypothetical protein SUGI_0337270 [Cryptomeria japonica]